jgi:hypothetical protein
MTSVDDDQFRVRSGYEGVLGLQRKKLLVPILAALLLFLPIPAETQDWLTRRAAGAVMRTKVAQDISRTALEAQMLTATVVNLEESGLDSVAVGQLWFRIARIELQNGIGIRVRAYLHNPTSIGEAIPAPTPDLFVLVDSRGRRIEVVDIEIEGLPEEASEISVPALERVGLSLLFADPPREPATATLKVGELGMIGGIPVHTGATPGRRQTENAQSNVWRPQ